MQETLRVIIVAVPYGYIHDHPVSEEGRWDLNPSRVATERTLLSSAELTRGDGPPLRSPRF